MNTLLNKNVLSEFIFRFLGILILGILSGCAQPEDDGVPVKIFPDQYFAAGYTENYEVSGSDSAGQTYSGYFDVVTGNETVFNGSEAVPVVTTLSYNTSLAGIQTPSITIVLTQYFSTTTPRHYLGSENSRTFVIMTPIDFNLLADIPLTVTGEGSGTLANSIGTDASEETISWSLVQIDESTYEIGLSFLHTDSAGGVLSHEVQSFQINSAGERLSWGLIAERPDLNVIFSFTGVRL